MVDSVADGPDRVWRVVVAVVHEDDLQRPFSHRSFNPLHELGNVAGFISGRDHN